jgi:hypothetical protein
MPLELGVFLGAMRFGQQYQRNKKCLILDKEPFRYQQFISDIAGQDIAFHHDSPEKLIRCIRDWLADASNTDLPSGSFIYEDYMDFVKKVPVFCRALRKDITQLTFLDYANLVAEWLKLAE